MSKERADCISFPADGAQTYDPEEVIGVPILMQYEGPNYMMDLHYPEAGIKVRTIDYRQLERQYTFPSGGFTLSRWFETQVDGSEKLTHYHVEIFPDLDEKASGFVARRLQATLKGERRGKAQELSDTLPSIQICPDRELTLRSKRADYFSFSAEGPVLIPKERIDSLTMSADRRLTPPAIRFATPITDVVDTETEEEYHLSILGTLYKYRIPEILQLLDPLVANGTLNERMLSAIVRFEAALLRK